VVAAKAEEEAATLEIWLFEDADAEGERHAYVHHDIPLPAFPLAVAWMSFNPAGAATGSHHSVATQSLLATT
jgi:periodic tryptophan protein 1